MVGDQISKLNLTLNLTHFIARFRLRFCLGGNPNINCQLAR